MVLLSHTGGRKLPNSKNTNRTMTTHATRYQLMGGTSRNIKIREEYNPLFVVRENKKGDVQKMNATNLETLRECEEAILDGAGVISGMVLCGAPTQIIKITAESIAGLIAVRNALQIEINAWMTSTKEEKQ